ncbi:hypothetical protein OEZ85_013762 [Tetradesmus obliquus]|uniref:Coatomer subunit delta n=1 Tax=Tetradesmus obliquus TaxID=3088 RepID=A0ABY8U631_TETOB|nr:hypothetical protein OEZ85_013762 [Tetradesmus obliquus]
MVVLAASIVSKSGKALVSRQYMDMSRIRIEGLLAAFPKLVGSGKQHTYVETENVRYVYQPIEGMFLLLVTNRGSNILEDLDTLRLLSKLVPEYAGGAGLDEEAVSRAAFDLVFAFDEVISHGHKENITVQQVKQNCEMESHEEKLHKMIIQSKINDTKDIMKRKAQEIDKHKIDAKRALPAGPGYNPAMAGLGGGGMGSSSSMSRPLGMDMDAGPSLGMPGLGSGGGFGGSSASSASAAAPKAGLPKKGMQLGKGKGAASILESLAKEEGVASLDEPSRPSVAVGGAPVGTQVISEPVFIGIDEKLTVVLSKTGGLESLEVQGTMSLVVGSDADAYVAAQIRQGANPGFQFKTHPNIDKAGYGNGVLGLKDPSRPFPTGSELGVLKWRFQSRDESLVPLTLSCWPSASGSECYVNMEYESAVDYDLERVVIAIPLPHMSHAPQVNQVDGDWRYDSRRGALLWSIDLIDNTNRSGSMEFVVPACDPDALYPIEVSFSSSKTFCDIAIEGVSSTQTGQPVKFGQKRGMSTAGYHVV